MWFLSVAVSLNALFSIRHSSRVRRSRQPTLCSSTFMSELARAQCLVKCPGRLDVHEAPSAVLVPFIHQLMHRFLVDVSITSSFMQPSQCSRLSDDPDLSMIGVFFVCVPSCPRLESVASIVHFAALLLLISSQSREYQSALLNDVFWSHVGGQKCRGISRSSGWSFVMFSRMRTSSGPNSASSSTWTWPSQVLELVYVALVFALEIRW